MRTRKKHTIPEDELVNLLKQQDSRALEYLYDHYSAALYGIIIRIVREEEVAEELLQDVFVKVWNKIGGYDSSKGRLFTWMLNVTRNLAIDRTRTKAFKNSQQTTQVDNNVDSIDRQWATLPKIDTIGLREILGNLNAEQRQVVELLYFKGYTQSEVAEEFEIPLGTVKTRARAAIRELRKILDVK